MAAGDLTAKQAAFVRQYLIHGDATRAAKEATYSEKTAAQQGYQLLQNPSVRAAVEAGQRDLAEKAGYDAEWVRRKLVENVERAMQETPVTDEDGNPVGIYVYAGAVANKALELLGKHFGMFKRDIDVHVSGQLTVDRLIELADAADDDGGDA